VLNNWFIANDRIKNALFQKKIVENLVKQKMMVTFVPRLEDNARVMKEDERY
jgi:hypothetical protein